jgi:hypothetical protein
MRDGIGDARQIELAVGHAGRSSSGSACSGLLQESSGLTSDRDRDRRSGRRPHMAAPWLLQGDLPAPEAGAEGLTKRTGNLRVNEKLVLPLFLLRQEESAMEETGSRQYPEKPARVYLFGTCLIDLFCPEAGMDTPSACSSARESRSIFPPIRPAVGNRRTAAAFPSRHARWRCRSCACFPNRGR